MRPFWKYIIAFAAIVVCTVHAHAEDESQFDVVMKRGKLVVATYSTQPPTSFKDENGNLVGFEIDLMRQLAKEMFGDPNKVDFVVVSSEGRIPSVLSGKVDIGMGMTTINPDRATKVAFTTPYIDVTVGVLAKKSAGITKADQLNDASRKFANLNSPPAQALVKSILPKIEQLLLQSPADQLLALQTGRADAMMTDSPTAIYYIDQNPDLVAVDVSGTDFANVLQNALYVKPGDFKFWLYLDTYVKELRYGGRYGVYKALYNKWFHRDPPPQRPWDPTKY